MTTELSLTAHPPPARASREQVVASQRARLLRAMADAVGEKGYAGTVVADVVDRARVSRKTFYAHFSDLEDCFMAAYDACIETLREEVTKALDRELDARTQGRRLLETYLGLLAAEPALARTYLVEGFSAGPRASARRREALADFAALVQSLHARLAVEGVTVRDLTALDFEMLVGAVVFTVTSRVATGDYDGLAGLAPALEEFLLRNLTEEVRG